MGICYNRMTRNNHEIREKEFKNARENKKWERRKKGVGGAEERGGEQERYALLEDWERKTTGRSKREGSKERERERERNRGVNTGEGEARSGRRFPVRGGKIFSCVC